MVIGIIGAGASGMAAALAASECEGAQVLLFERQARVGRKLQATGNGRCNLSNLHADTQGLHGEDPEFSKFALSQFGVADTLKWFDELGLYTVSEKSGRVYPYSDQANSVVDVLRFALQRDNITLISGFEVAKAKETADGFRVEGNGEVYPCDKLIIACGGLAGTKLGGSMSGYQLLRGFGHHMTKLRPSLVQLKSSWSGCAALKGVRAQCAVSVLNGDALHAKSVGELQFTDYGLSGPVIFEVSRDTCHAKGDWHCVLDFLPDMDEKMLFSLLEKRKNSALLTDELFTGILHNRLGRVLTQSAGIRSGIPISSLRDDELFEAVRAVKSLDVTLTEPMGMEHAQVTAGGAVTDEFDPQTMESRIAPGLYACGEVLDVDGDCGGYNLQWAWSSGRLAGQNAGGKTMIRIRDISMQPMHDPNQLLYEAARLLKITGSKIRALRLVRRSIDARFKPDVRIIYTVDVAVDGNEQNILKFSGCKKASIAPVSYYKVPVCHVDAKQRPVIVGFGPAGMFAALVLAIAGLKPIVLERGDDAATRHEKVQHFFKTGQLDETSNVQFGEGGAGTFSDGKLNTGVNNPRIGWILEQFVQAGAREDILYDAKPHVGTDVLLEVVQNIRRRIISLGGEVRFNTKVTGLLCENGAITGVQTEQGAVCSKHVILAIGHSARDTFRMLEQSGIPMEEKPFAMGVRIEQLQSVIDKTQYGSNELPLPPADYKLVRHLENETVYTFCMCPGGHVVAAASEQGKIVTNGMSNADRDGENANAAVLVSLNPADFPYPGVLGGMLWQEEIEKKAYSYSGSFCAPAQLVGDFLKRQASTGSAAVEPTYRPGVVWCDLHEILPEKITTALRTALPMMDNNLRGFAAPEAVLTAPETRSSSPVRILRGEDRQSSLRGLYPAGEGAGYAGGIMSAAIDGMQAAEAIIAQLEEEHHG